MNKKRGLLINIVLFIYTFNSILGLIIVLLNNKLKSIDTDGVLNTTNIIMTVIVSIITLISVIGIIMWKKVAAYTLGAISIFNYVSSFYISDIESMSLVLSTIMLCIVLFTVYSLLKKINSASINIEKNIKY